jgi:hypothetical protein
VLVYVRVPFLRVIEYPSSLLTPKVHSPAWGMRTLPVTRITKSSTSTFIVVPGNARSESKWPRPPVLK